MENLDLDGVIIPVENIEAMIKAKQGIRLRGRDDLQFLEAFKEKP